MTYKNLLQFGLDEKEAKVYLASLELGETNIQRISKKSGVKRTTVYDIIESLKEKGLINSITKQKRLFYYAEDPRKMEEQLEEKKNHLKKMLPELLSIANVIDKKPKVRFFEGVEGIKDIYLEMLNYKDSKIFAWVSETGFLKEFAEFFNGYYTPQRKKRRIWVQAICPNNKEMQEYKKRDINEFRKTKLTSDQLYPIRISINLFGNNVTSIVSFEEQIGLIIESEKIFTTMRSIFEMNWLNLTD